MKPMSVSVVIPTFNSGRLVTEAVESVLAQTVPPAEIIVVDDGSSDDTRERLGRFGDRVEYRYQENQGVSAARNLGVSLAAGDYVAFLDADDMWHPRKLEIQTAVLASRAELGLLGTELFDWPAPAVPEVREPGADAVAVIPWRRLAVKNYFTTSSLLVRREALNRAGPFDREMQGPEDYDLWLRVAACAPVANLKAPLTGYRTVAGSLSKQAERMQDGMRRILRKLDERGAWQGDWRLRRKAYSYCDYSCAYMFGAAGCHGCALTTLLRSLTRYPWPYQADEVRMPLARVRLLGTTLRKMLKQRGVASQEATDLAAARVNHAEACLTGAEIRP